MLRSAILVALAVLPLATASAAEVAHLYRAEAIVTGTVEPERTRGMRAGLIDVIVKLTGDARLAENAAVKSMVSRPHDFVERFEYRDRMKGIPLHDEQGTRERPYDLLLRFKPAKIDSALRTLGLSKWDADRPTLAVWFAVRTASEQYVLRRSGDAGYGQRAVFVETARRRGIPILLPRQTPPAAAIRFGDVAARNMPKLRAASPGADALLLGTLVLVPSGYWDIDWQMRWRGHTRRWKMQDVTFDTAIKDGLQRSALIFSGNAKD